MALGTLEGRQSLSSDNFVFRICNIVLASTYSNFDILFTSYLLDHVDGLSLSVGAACRNSSNSTFFRHRILRVLKGYMV
jgi:hypothetical protein